MGLEARIWASRLEFRPQDLDFCLETGIWAARLEFEGGGTEEKMEKEKIPHMCESIGHRPLQGRCPKGRKRSFLQCFTVSILTDQSENSVIAWYAHRH